MAGSSQKFIARSRAPRVQIEYDVELYGAEKKVQLPFVMGVMADLSGNPADPLPAVADRKFLEIDVDTFDSRMKAMKPRAAFSVPNTLTGEGNMAVDLTFEAMDDFTPAAIARKVGPLQALLQARTELANLLTYMDGKAGAEALIEKVLGDRALLSALTGAPATEDTAAALASLRSGAPAIEAQPDTTASTLAALRAANPVAEAPTDTTADALAALRAATPSTEAPTDTTAEALAALRAATPVAEAPTDTTADALAALRAATPSAEAPTDTTTDALAALRTPTPVVEAVEDATADALAALRAVSPVIAAVPDTTAEALAAVRAAAPVAEAGSDAAAEALAALREAVPVAPAAPETTADALAALRASAPVEDAAPDATADALDALRAAAPVVESVPDAAAGAFEALRAAAPVAATASDTTADALATMRASAIVEAALPTVAVADVLSGLRDGLQADAPQDKTSVDLTSLFGSATDEVSLSSGVAEARPVEQPASAPLADPSFDLDGLQDVSDLASQDDALTAFDGMPAAAGAVVEDDPLSGLDYLLAAPEAAVEDDPLAGLDDLLAAPEVAVEEDPLAGLNDLLAAPEAAVEEDPLAGLDDLLAAPEVAVEEDPLAGLDDLLAAPEASVEDDPLAGLDDLLAAPEASVEDDPLAGLDDLLAAPEVAVEEDLLAGLDDLLSPSSATVDDPLAGLDDLLAGPAPTKPTPAVRKEPAMSAADPYGRLTAPLPTAEALARPVFRIAILGDFSGRAARGVIEVGDALAARKGISFDVDNVEEVIEGFGMDLVLPIGAEGQGITVPMTDLDSLHPDQLVENVALFDELKGLRQRLGMPSMAAKAVAEMQAWGGAFRTAPMPSASRSAGTAVPPDLRLSDFQRLIGDREGRLSTPSPAADLIAQVVGPYIVPGPNAQANALRATVDEAMAAAMRLVLHHPEFQTVEAQWRSLDLLARRIETDVKLELVAFDISAEELAADLSAQEDLGKSGLFRLLNGPLLEEGGNGFSAVCGMYSFEETPPHATLLGRAARIAQHVQAPFFAAMSPAYLETAKADRHPLVSQAWEALRAEPAAAWLGLAAPRFLLRRPYGERSEPIDAFDFEEFTMAEGLSGMLWTNPVVLVAILLGQAWKAGKGKPVLGQTMSLGEMPYHFATDRHGDQVPLPCTERNMTTEKVEQTVSRGFMPVIGIKGRDVVRLGSFQSVAGSEIAGRWSGNVAAAPRPAPKPALEATHAPPEAATSLDDDLDALLAGFADTPAAPADPGSIDADLAALLEGL